MATLVCLLEGQALTKSDENHCFFTEGNFNRKCQSHVWLWFCPSGMFTQGLRKPLVLPRECEPQASNTTCAFASIGVACSELVACEENSIAAKTSMFLALFDIFREGLCCRCASNILEDSVLPVGDFEAQRPRARHSETYEREACGQVESSRVASCRCYTRLV